MRASQECARCRRGRDKIAACLEPTCASAVVSKLNGALVVFNKSTSTIPSSTTCRSGDQGSQREILKTRVCRANHQTADLRQATLWGALGQPKLIMECAFWDSCSQRPGIADSSRVCAKLLVRLTTFGSASPLSSEGHSVELIAPGYLARHNDPLRPPASAAHTSWISMHAGAWQAVSTYIRCQACTIC